MKNLRDIGEFGWINEVRRYTHGIGDDTAVLPGPKKDFLLTTDMILEGRHFTRKNASAFEIGWKAMAVNLSDIAAMGGVPLSAVVSAAVPASTSVGFLKEIYRGLKAAADRFGAKIVGGDTNQGNTLTLAVTLLGEVEKGKALLRSGAKPGDWIFVTGSLGGSYVSKKHLRFIPRVREARWLSRNFRVHAMMDLSDGLASDIRHIGDESGVGAILNEVAIPRSKSATTKQALSDGEDFELLLTLSPEEGTKLLKHKAPKGFPAFSHVGWIVKGGRMEILGRNGKLKKIEARGFDHYR